MPDVNITRADGEVCERPCFEGFENSPKDQPDCCDKIWLPTVYLSNLYQFFVEATGAPITSSISVDYEGGRVVWQQHLRASFYAEYDFRAFPFDRQALVVQFEPRAFDEQHKTVLNGSRIAYDEKPDGISEDINGWRIDTSREPGDLFYWSVSSRFGKENTVIECQSVVANYTEGSGQELRDTTRDIIEQLGH